jgi:hypothetical protein
MLFCVTDVRNEMSGRRRRPRTIFSPEPGTSPACTKEAVHVDVVPEHPVTTFGSPARSDVSIPVWTFEYARPRGLLHDLVRHPGGRLPPREGLVPEPDRRRVAEDKASEDDTDRDDGPEQRSRLVLHPVNGTARRIRSSRSYASSSLPQGIGPAGVLRGPGDLPAAGTRRPCRPRSSPTGAASRDSDLRHGSSGRSPAPHSNIHQEWM